MNVIESIYNSVYEGYGIKPMSLEEEINLPMLQKQTRQNKIEIIDTCKHMRNLIDTLEWRAKSAPELNDVRHAALVQEMRDKVKEAYKAVEEAFRVGY